MKSKAFLLTSLAYIIPTMIIGYVWHLILFKDLYDSLGIYNRAKPIIPLGFFSMIIQGIILSYFYQFYTHGKSTMKKAILYNQLMGLLFFSLSTLANAAKMEVTSMTTWLIIQVTFTFLQFTVAGVLIGLVNKN